MNDTKQLDEYFSGRLSPEDRLLMDARLLVDADLADRSRWQQQTYSIIQAYGRKKLKMEIIEIQKRMFSETRFENFRKKIKTIFS